MIDIIKISSALIVVILSTFCYLPYLRDIINRKTTPHIYSWLIWSILQTIGTVTIIADGGGYGALGIGIGTIFCITIFILSFTYGTKNITRFDIACLFGSCFAILTLLFSKDLIYSVVLISLIDLLAFLPTYRKGYEEPYSETISTYFISTISGILSLIAIENYSLITVPYLLSITLSNAIFTLIILLRRMKLKL